jgi:hypothetical protein
MHDAPASLAHQSSSFERQLHPGVAEGKAVPLAQLLVKMA